jgi:iron-sulfur cluster repair protein YtfE (RIC family)
MLPTSEIKARYNNFYMEGYIYVHRTMSKNLADMVKISKRLDSLTVEELTRLNEWFNFIYIMIEHHHLQEDDPNGFFSFPTINKNFPMQGLEQLIADHTVLEVNMGEIREKLRNLLVVTGQTERVVIISRLQYLLVETEREMREHLTAEEAVLVPLINDNYTKAEQINLGKKIERQSMKETPKQFAAFGLPWFMSGLNSEDKAQFLTTLPLPPKLLLQYSWSKKYEKFSTIMNVPATL